MKLIEKLQGELAKAETPKEKKELKKVIECLDIVSKYLHKNYREGVQFGGLYQNENNV